MRIPPLPPTLPVRSPQGGVPLVRGRRRVQLPRPAPLACTERVALGKAREPNSSRGAKLVVQRPVFQTVLWDSISPLRSECRCPAGAGAWLPSTMRRVRLSSPAPTSTNLLVMGRGCNPLVVEFDSRRALRCARRRWTATGFLVRQGAGPSPAAHSDTSHSSSGQDDGFSIRQRESDSPMGHCGRTCVRTVTIASFSARSACPSRRTRR